MVLELSARLFCGELVLNKGIWTFNIHVEYNISLLTVFLVMVHFVYYFLCSFAPLPIAAFPFLSIWRDSVPGLRLPEKIQMLDYI